MDFYLEDTLLTVKEDATIEDLLIQYEKINNIELRGNIFINGKLATPSDMVSDHILEGDNKYVDFIDTPGYILKGSTANHLVRENSTIGECVMGQKFNLANFLYPYEIFNFVEKSDKIASYYLCTNKNFYKPENIEIRPGSGYDYQISYNIPTRQEFKYNREEKYCIDDLPLGNFISQKELPDALKKYNALISGSSITKIVSRLDYEVGDVDIFSESLDFLRYILKINVENNMDLSYHNGGGFHSYKLASRKQVLNFVHTGIDGNVQNLAAWDTKPLSALITNLSEKFDLSCCCCYWDGETLFYNTETAERRTYSRNIKFLSKSCYDYSDRRKRKYTNRGFELVENNDDFHYADQNGNIISKEEYIRYLEYDFILVIKEKERRNSFDFVEEDNEFRHRIPSGHRYNFRIKQEFLEDEYDPVKNRNPFEYFKKEGVILSGKEYMEEMEYFYHRKPYVYLSSRF